MFAELPTETFSNLRYTNESSATVATYLRWDLPKSCSSITGPIRASKLFIGKSKSNFSVVETTDLFYPLFKSTYAGCETYIVHLHTLRNLGGQENKIIFTELEFTIPARGKIDVKVQTCIEIST